MKSFTNGKIAVMALLCAGMVFGGCSKDEEAQMTSLELTALNESGNRVSGAKVTVYDSKEAWVKHDASGMVGFGETDENGVILIPDLKTQRYWFDVTQGTSTLLSNVTGNIAVASALEEGRKNTLNVVISESVEGYLVDEGKKWSVEAFLIDNVDYTTEYKATCSGDDVIQFMKDGTTKWDEGPSVCEGSFQNYEGVYKVEDILLTLNDPVSGLEEYLITNCTNNTFVIHTEIDGVLYTLGFEPTF